MRESIENAVPCPPGLCMVAVIRFKKLGKIEAFEKFQCVKRGRKYVLRGVVIPGEWSASLVVRVGSFVVVWLVLFPSLFVPHTET